LIVPEIVGKPAIDLHALVAALLHQAFRHAATAGAAGML
jgi:hypothetical protein